jgi:hypothetical protein
MLNKLTAEKVHYQSSLNLDFGRAVKRVEKGIRNPLDLHLSLCYEHAVINPNCSKL